MTDLPRIDVFDCAGFYYIKLKKIEKITNIICHSVRDVYRTILMTHGFSAIEFDHYSTFKMRKLCEDYYKIYFLLYEPFLCEINEDGTLQVKFRIEE